MGQAWVLTPVLPFMDHETLAKWALIFFSLCGKGCNTYDIGYCKVYMMCVENLALSGTKKLVSGYS